MKNTAHWPLAEAQVALAVRFGLPHTPNMQDWEYEVADVGRFDEFLSAYTPSLPEEQRCVLMEMLVQCVEDSGADGKLDFLWSKLRPILEANQGLHARTISYWACLDADNEDGMFHVASRMRGLGRPPY